MANKKITWQEKVSDTKYNGMYPETDSSQVILNNTINNNLGINVDSRLDAALESVSNTTKSLRAEGVSTGNALSLELSVPVFSLVDGVMARVRIHTNTSTGATLNVNNTGAKPIIRIDGEPIDLELKQGTWCIFIYSATLDSWVFEGWSTSTISVNVLMTESGTFAVPSNVTSLTVSVTGGAGGGNGTTGETTTQEIAVTPGQNIDVTIGSGGTSTGSNGGITSFGTYLSANGGKGVVVENGTEGASGCCSITYETQRA